MKYNTPQILLLDLPDEASQVLFEAGFNVFAGSLGRPYQTEKSGSFVPVICHNADVPNQSEVDIVVVDFSYGELGGGADGLKHRPEGELDIWAKADKGLIDPRPRTVAQVQANFNRVYQHGGVFIVFSDILPNIEMQLARETRGGYGTILSRKEEFPVTLWDLVSPLSFLGVEADSGSEMNVNSIEESPELEKLLKRYLPGSEFRCTFKGTDWLPLAHNKFGDSVALYRHDTGRIFVLPQVTDKVAFLADLFTNVLPVIVPDLFPDLVKGSWIHDAAYELPQILELSEQQQVIRDRATEQIAELEAVKEAARQSDGWIHRLLTGTGDELVDAVKRALASLGFQNIIDVDEERDAAGESRREDLQIKDQPETLVVDVKGISGCPTDDDALQADKHATFRMREWDSTKVSGLSIINHQRHLPPHERDNSMPFRQEIIDAAEESRLGLVTGWDLYRLVKNARKWVWEAKNVIPIFYRYGRIEIVPDHYEYVGVIAKAWTDKFGVVIESGEVECGDRIAVEFPIDFEEAEVTSIRVNDRIVERAEVGDQTGFSWSSDLPRVREGMRVFRIRKVES